jgi:hypothetical protein
MKNEEQYQKQRIKKKNFIIHLSSALLDVELVTLLEDIYWPNLRVDDTK